MEKKILIVDDDSSIRYSVSKILSEEGFLINTASSGEEALEKIKKILPDVILMDIRMGKMGGLETLKEVKKIDEKLPVILMTAFSTTQSTIEAMKHGAYDYLTKPFDAAELKELIHQAWHVRLTMRHKVTINPTEMPNPEEDTIIGSSRTMQNIYKLIGQVAPKDVTVLIRGESGTGKELIARAIYHHSQRKDKPFLSINCAAIPENLLESELFGHEKGSFTGAHTLRIGKFEQCHHGTILLDEIGDLSPSLQAKFLRVLQEQEFQRVGSNEVVHVDVRIIAATNKDLESAIKKGDFREDLFYRLNTITVTLPRLRDHQEDIPQLCHYFINKFTIEFNKKLRGFAPNTLEKLINYPWPGNIRELENTIKRAVITAKGHLILPDDIQTKESTQTATESAEEINEISKIAALIFERLLREGKGKQNAQILNTLEKELLKITLSHTLGNQVQASRLLGMNRSTLRKKIELFNLKKDITVSDA
ncbi:MAG: sigma-54 dependent transcriptional regulator [Chlamydiota bacterium]|nr:sigma-54 dependent transcriptional regulator [Chlamydiota bacterium]